MGCGVALTYLENKHQIYLETLETKEDVRPMKVKVKEGDFCKLNKTGEIGKMKSQTNNNKQIKVEQVSYQIPVKFEHTLKQQTNYQKGKNDLSSDQPKNKTEMIKPTSEQKKIEEKSIKKQIQKVSEAKVSSAIQHKVKYQNEINSSIKVQLKQPSDKQLKQNKVNEQVSNKNLIKTAQIKTVQNVQNKNKQAQKRLLIQQIVQEDNSDSQVEERSVIKVEKEQKKEIAKPNVEKKRISNENKVVKPKDFKTKQNAVPENKGKPQSQAQKKKQKKDKIPLQKKIEQQKAAMQKQQKKIEQMKKKFYEQQQKKLKKQASQLKQIYVL